VKGEHVCHVHQIIERFARCLRWIVDAFFAQDAAFIDSDTAPCDTNVGCAFLQTSVRKLTSRASFQDKRRVCALFMEMDASFCVLGEKKGEENAQTKASSHCGAHTASKPRFHVGLAVKLPRDILVTLNERISRWEEQQSSSVLNVLGCCEGTEWLIAIVRTYVPEGNK
tara:strand:- start:152 stop:658 length:507 start_codon:yes stop_codon:yes gene_type:complete